MQRECQYAEMIMIDLAVKKQYYTDTDKGGLIACEVFVAIFPKSGPIFYKAAVPGFTNDFSIPFGNNLAEQAIRMMKVKQKISGCFRSGQGAKDFANIRSHIATMQNQGYETFLAIHDAKMGYSKKLLA